MQATYAKLLHASFKQKKSSSKPIKRLQNSILSMKTEGDRDKKSFVDKNLIVLRRRIHEAKMKEANYAPPSKWWAWEKKWHEVYGNDVIEIVGLLQIMVMNARPSSVLATGVFLVICVVIAMYSLVGFVGHAILWLVGFIYAFLVMNLAIL